MNHPSIIAVPILMLADYGLTIAGANASSKVYRRHFVIPSYELNPLWQNAIAKRRWFNPRHLILVCALTALLVWSDRASDLSFDVMSFTLGMLFGGFGSVCGQHLANLLQFSYLNRNPTQLTGQVQWSHIAILRISMFRYLGLIPMLALLAVLVPRPPVFGALIGVSLLAFAHAIWAWRAKRRAGGQVAAITPPAVDVAQEEPGDGESVSANSA